MFQRSFQLFQFFLWKNNVDFKTMINIWVKNFSFLMNVSGYIDNDMCKNLPESWASDCFSARIKTPKAKNQTFGILILKTPTTERGMACKEIYKNYIRKSIMYTEQNISPLKIFYGDIVTNVCRWFVNHFTFDI